MGRRTWERWGSESSCFVFVEASRLSNPTISIAQVSRHCYRGRTGTRSAGERRIHFCESATRNEENQSLSLERARTYSPIVGKERMRVSWLAESRTAEFWRREIWLETKMQNRNNPRQGLGIAPRSSELVKRVLQPRTLAALAFRTKKSCSRFCQSTHCDSSRRHYAVSQQNSQMRDSFAARFCEGSKNRGGEDFRCSVTKNDRWCFPTFVGSIRTSFLLCRTRVDFLERSENRVGEEFSFPVLIYHISL